MHIVVVVLLLRKGHVGEFVGAVAVSINTDSVGLLVVPGRVVVVEVQGLGVLRIIVKVALELGRVRQLPVVLRDEVGAVRVSAVRLTDHHLLRVHKGVTRERILVVGVRRRTRGLRRELLGAEAERIVEPAVAGKCYHVFLIHARVGHQTAERGDVGVAHLARFARVRDEQRGVHLIERILPHRRAARRFHGGCDLYARARYVRARDLRSRGGYTRRKARQPHDRG